VFPVLETRPHRASGKKGDGDAQKNNLDKLAAAPHSPERPTGNAEHVRDLVSGDQQRLWKLCYPWHVSPPQYSSIEEPFSLIGLVAGCA
jgi:hypothetical protein